MLWAGWWRRPSYEDISYFFRLSSLSNDLQIGASGIEVEVQGLSANGHFDEVLDVVGVGLGWNGAVLALQDNSEKAVEDVVWVGRSQAVLVICLEQGKRAIAVIVAVVEGRDAEDRRGARLGGGGTDNSRSCGEEQSKLAGGNHFDRGLT